MQEILATQATGEPDRTTGSNSHLCPRGSCRASPQFSEVQGIFKDSRVVVEIGSFSFDNTSPVEEGLWDQEDTEKFSNVDVCKFSNSLEKKRNIQVSRPVSASHMQLC